MLNRLRRHRWLWALVLIVLSFKLVAGTVCLNDASVNSHAASTAIAATPQVAAALNLSFDESSNACLLGEVGGCHCACAETLPIPATLTLSFGPAAPRSAFDPLSYAFSPAYTGSPLRPPIA
jgi:hypothetical protein